MMAACSLRYPEQRKQAYAHNWHQQIYLWAQWASQARNGSKNAEVEHSRGIGRVLQILHIPENIKGRLLVSCITMARGATDRRDELATASE